VDVIVREDDDFALRFPQSRVSRVALTGDGGVDVTQIDIGQMGAIYDRGRVIRRVVVHDNQFDLPAFRNSGLTDRFQRTLQAVGAISRTDNNGNGHVLTTAVCNCVNVLTLCMEKVRLTEIGWF
jgi:hypothetical protein